MQVERRRHERFGYTEGIYCYLDGYRFDARSRDLSSSGMFLATDRDLPLGHRLAMVFKLKKTGDEPVILIGEVVRRQTSPVLGVGIEWRRALYDGSAEVLKSFLSDVLKLDSTVVNRRPFGRSKTEKAVFVFPRADSTVVESELEVDSSGGVFSPARCPSAEEVLAEVHKRLESLRVAEDYAAPPRYDKVSTIPKAVRVEAPPTTDYGPLTQVVESTVHRYPTRLACSMDFGGVGIPGTITFFGLGGLFVQTSHAPGKSGSKVVVNFDLPTRQGRTSIECKCRLTSVDDGAVTGQPGVDLDILSTNEGKARGILSYFVRWLSVKAMEKA